ncbi:chemotaxis protein CheW [Paramaledivibacter caminithermalis]|uniref:Purine-binding chemotaxis protein CheW n=1 Tax=Paramaledivibacter caminithermalis (strain DSM 15212 / CIP 107654 / DViRD3) TaxID=1121301 RepID=A0A1M6P8L3_PARC5|nr:chemotaxis protein CheW [Paramaledivibacter caminithermalis]SHK04279.1 purine-binding chemotaxis protein CheW [Paramaledivibacter caminithermalis DSM 15212]
MTKNQYVVFSLGEEEYGINILAVSEINRLKEIEITKVPKAPEYIEGIINLRGDVVPVVNLRKKFNIGMKDLDKETRIIVVKINFQNVGILVDKVGHVAVFEEHELSAPPEEIVIDSNYIAGVGKKDEGMVFLLDIDKVLGGKIS